MDRGNHGEDRIEEAVGRWMVKDILNHEKENFLSCQQLEATGILQQGNKKSDFF